MAKKVAHGGNNRRVSGLYEWMKKNCIKFRVKKENNNNTVFTVMPFYFHNINNFITILQYTYYLYSKLKEYLYYYLLLKIYQSLAFVAPRQCNLEKNSATPRPMWRAAQQIWRAAHDCPAPVVKSHVRYRTLIYLFWYVDQLWFGLSLDLQSHRRWGERGVEVRGAPTWLSTNMHYTIAWLGR